MILEEDLRVELGRLPASLTDTYTTIHEQKSLLAPSSQLIFQKSLKWLLCMKSSLSVAGFLTAITLNATNTAKKVNREEVLDICSSFVVLDENTNVFRFAHFSVMEFLVTRAEYTMDSAHALAAETCLSIFSYNCGGLRCSPVPEDPLQHYAVKFWAHHCQMAEHRRFEGVLNKLFRDFLRVSSEPFLIWNRMARASFYGSHDDEFSLSQSLGSMLSTPPDPIFAASTWGFLEIVQDRLGLSNETKARKSRWKFKSEPRMLRRVNERGRTCFLNACECGQRNVVQLLLEQGARINSKDRWNMTGLHLAAEEGHESVVELLLDKNVRTDLKDDFNETALFRAVRRRHKSVVRLLLKRGIKIQIGESIDVAAAYGSASMLQLLLDCDDAIASKKRTREFDALVRASIYGNISIIHLLVQRGVDVNRSDSSGKRPLHYVIQSTRHIRLSGGDINSVVQELLNAGADIEARDLEGATPLHYVVKANDSLPEGLKVLLDNGADLAAKTNDGKTAMDAALPYGGRAKTRMTEMAFLGLRDTWYNILPPYEYKANHLVKFLMLVDYGLDVEAKEKLRAVAENSDSDDVENVLAGLNWLRKKYHKNTLNRPGEKLFEPLSIIPLEPDVATFRRWMRDFRRSEH